MYGPYSPCGKCSRMQQRFQAATKDATKVTRCTKVATKFAGYCEGFNNAKKAAVKVVTKVVGYFESCHIGCRLLRRLQQRLLVAAEAIAKVAGCCYAKAMASTFLLKQALTQAPMKVTQPSFPKQSITKAAPFKYDRGCENVTQVMVVVTKIMDIDQKCGKRPRNEEDIAVIVTPKEANVYGIIDSVNKGFVEVNNKKKSNKGTTRYMDHRRHVHNEDVRTEYDYNSVDYDKEREMERRLVRVSKLLMFSDQGLYVEEGEIHGVNLPPLLAAQLGRSGNGQPLQSPLTFGYGGNQPSINLRGNPPPNDLPTTYKGLIEKTYTWIEVKEVSINGAHNDHKEGSDKFSKGFYWDNNKGRKKNRDRSLRVDSKIPLVGFSDKHSWPLGEVPLEVTIGEIPYTRTKTLNFVIVRYNSPYNLLLKRTSIQKMGIVVSTIHAAVKFHTPCGIEAMKDVLSCTDIEERIVVNNKHPEQTVIIRKQLPTSFKRKLYELLRSNVDMFAWTYANMTGISSSIMMPFGLNNEGENYQRLVDKVFNDQIGRNLEAYVDDMVIKSASEKDMLLDIHETFDRLRSINIKLNLCSFGVEKGPFLGHPITKQRIKANPSKVKGTDKSLPFFKALKSCTDKKTIQWIADAEEAFRKMKEFIEILPTLTTPIKGKVLVMYLAASTTERKRDRFRSTLLTRRLQRYFQAHSIRVLIDKPIKQILARPKKSERIAKWTMKLGEHDIEFQGRNSVKGKILADEASKNIWKLYTDGASILDGSGAGLMLVSPEGKEFMYALRFEFETTNNEAKYEAEYLAIFVDSQLVAKLKASSKLGSLSFLTPWLRCIGPSQAKEVIQEVHKGSYEFNIEPRFMIAKNYEARLLLAIDAQRGGRGYMLPLEPNYQHMVTFKLHGEETQDLLNELEMELLAEVELRPLRELRNE
ncbi:reverse transcriptase domain-containing protein [Tanacetum coccineum]